jgi:hypothetical protein
LATLPATTPWFREVLAYRSGLLDQLRDGLVAPRCYGMQERPDGSLWLWLEDLGRIDGQPWAPAQYGRIAGHIGRFNGAWAAAPLPTPAPWWSTDWLRTWVAGVTEPLTAFATAAGHPPAEVLCPAPLVEQFLHLWEERARFLAGRDLLPRTLCHHDLNRRNLFWRPDPRGAAQLVAIDWADMGLGVVGEDLGPLVLSTLWWDHIPLHRAREVEAATFAAYVAGLRMAGWRGEVRTVRLGYTIWMALRCGSLVALWLVEFAAGTLTVEALGCVLGCSEEQTRVLVRATLQLALACADEARALLATL